MQHYPPEKSPITKKTLNEELSEIEIIEIIRVEKRESGGPIPTG
jgi:hypothetical protein